MADESDKPVVEDVSKGEAANIPDAETIPSKVGGLSAVGSADAPWIYFDLVPTSGYSNGVANVTLEGIRRYLAPDNRTIIADRVIVAHLRMSFPAAMALRDALNGVEMIATPPKGQPN